MFSSYLKLQFKWHKPKNILFGLVDRSQSLAYVTGVLKRNSFAWHSIHQYIYVLTCILHYAMWGFPLYLHVFYHCVFLAVYTYESLFWHLQSENLESFPLEHRRSYLYSIFFFFNYFIYKSILRVHLISAVSQKHSNLLIITSRWIFGLTLCIIYRECCFFYN